MWNGTNALYYEGASLVTGSVRDDGKIYKIDGYSTTGIFCGNVKNRNDTLCRSNNMFDVQSS